jgi:hypothetical protein
VSVSREDLSKFGGKMLGELLFLKERVRALEDACFSMAEDGWLEHGSEGMSDAQKLVYAVIKDRIDTARAGKGEV